MPSSQSLGLIAGSGKFPVLFARQAKFCRYQIVAAGIRGDTSLFLPFFVEKFQWFQAGELKRLFAYFRGAGIQKVIMAGQVNPNHLFDKHTVLDSEFRDLFSALQDRKADTIFLAVADRLKSEGLELIDSTFLLKEHMAPRGTLTRRGPTLGELADIEFGKTIAKAMGGLDVGQTVVVKDKAIVAIEAMEGTDRTILRGGKISSSGAVVVKMSKPNQDFRFDVPVIGPRTIQTMRAAKAGCLAIEAGRTIVINREQCIRLANKAGICVLAS